MQKQFPSIKPYFLAHITALFLILNSAAHADFIRVDGGAGIWRGTPSGDISSNTGIVDTVNVEDTLGYSQETNPYAWILIKQPIPIIPNFRFEFLDLDYSGNSKTEFNFDDETYSIDSQSTTKLKQFDVIAYYNMLDNTFWLTLDLGLDIKYIEAEQSINDSTIPTNNYNISENVLLPMLYGRVRAEIPGTSIGVEGDAKYLQFSGVTVYDYRVKVDYTVDIPVLLKPGIEIGYREQKVKLDKSSFDLLTDITIRGPYLGAMVRF